MKFLHAADLHLDSPLRGLERYPGAPVAALRAATRRALENLVDLALTEAVDFVLLAGDLYDGDWRDYQTGLFFSQQMQCLAAAAIPTFVIAGNHDAASQITKLLRPPPTVQVFATHAPESRFLDSLGVVIHGQGFPTRSVSDDLTRAYPNAIPELFNIGLLHTALDGRPGHATYAPCSVHHLRERHYQYWALGHVHQHEIIAQDPWIVFPGNTQGRHANETGAKGCVLVEVLDNRVVKVKHWPIDVVRWQVNTLDVSSAMTLDDIYDQVSHALGAMLENADGRLLALRLRLIGSCAINTRLRAQQEQVMNQCRVIAGSVEAERLWLERVILDTQPASAAFPTGDRTDPYAGLVRAIHSLKLNPERLSVFSRELSVLSARLPADLRNGETAFDPTRPEFLHACLDDVKALLLERLLGSGDNP